ncbi:MAG TPA: hypothetical protein VFB63_12200 [Bryobacteraceae bacterium]|jgi:hypothetical protein|nr:hypothetical protein [Bryobacteraceae bacterium]
MTKMTTKTNVTGANSNDNQTMVSEAKNVRPEPVSLRVRTAVKAGFSFTSKVSKSSPVL